ncbi:PP2C family protein-serine/threonine phosphatase [Paraherbaspirillum soli]|uniref:PP2C family protein-serine/threonine phosphatase n=1 Tax=Paraherbaspirillum soli TaxID=631222 RepID=A0ABW0M8G5_9BURK
MADTPSSGNALVLTSSQLTNVGGRQSNQDALASARQDDLACFVVSDGVGGQEGGEIASNIVVKAVLDRFQQEATFSPRALQAYIDFAVIKLVRRQSEEPRLKDMSATVAALLIDRKNRSVLWAHMGDTRVYHFRGGKVHRVTKDHSLVQQCVDAGHCQPEQLRTHPQRSILCAAVGVAGDGIAEVTQLPEPVQAGDSFLICTDGFWEWIDESEMESAAAAADSAKAWLTGMHAIVEKNGGASKTPRDDCTAFTIYLSTDSSTATLT